MDVEHWLPILGLGPNQLTLGHQSTISHHLDLLSPKTDTHF